MACRKRCLELDSWAPFTMSFLTGAVTTMDVFPAPPTPPLTQAPVLMPASALGTDANGGLKRHEHFYETSEDLVDAVILRVRHELARATV
jgi:hypothetical protein